VNKWIDLHIDTLQFIVDDGVDPLTPTPTVHVDLPRLKQAGVIASVWTAWVDQILLGPSATARALTMMRAGQTMVERSDGELKTILTPADLGEIIHSESSGVIFAMEGASPLLGSLELLEAFFDLGLRVLTLTWNHDNEFATGCKLTGGKDIGLTDAGFKLIERLQAKGIVVDLAHASPRTLRDALTCLNRPFMVSHTNCRQLHDHIRNLTDEEVALISRGGGIIGISIYPGFMVGENEIATTKTVADHIEHAVAIAGDDAVAIGTDFDGITSLPADINGVEDLPRIAAELERRGWSQQRIEKIAWRNAARLIGDAMTPPDIDESEE